jgi:hypothetical protein
MRASLTFTGRLGTPLEDIVWLLPARRIVRRKCDRLGRCQSLYMAWPEFRLLTASTCILIEVSTWAVVMSVLKRNRAHRSGEEGLRADRAGPTLCLPSGSLRCWFGACPSRPKRLRQVADAASCIRSAGINPPWPWIGSGLLAHVLTFSFSSQSVVTCSWSQLLE